jgi:hypothetical protein
MQKPPIGGHVALYRHDFWEGQRMGDGIFGLTDPRDLLDKLTYDLKRLKADEGQQAMLYTAYDFFVTAYSLVDWEKEQPHMTPAQKDALYAPMIIKICSDIANGSKHFRRDKQSGRRDKQPKTTVKTHSASPVFDSVVFDSNDFDAAWSAWVELSLSEAQAVGVPECCPVVELAEKALEYWRGYYQHSPHS